MFIPSTSSNVKILWVVENNIERKLELLQKELSKATQKTEEDLENFQDCLLWEEYDELRYQLERDYLKSKQKMENIQELIEDTVQIKNDLRLFIYKILSL